MKFKEELADFYGVKIFVNRDDTAGNIILKGENPEQVEIETILKNIKDDSIIVDIGACYGEYTLVCAKKLEDIGESLGKKSQGLVIAIEPNPYHFKLLKKGVELNGLRNVILINKALSDSGRVERMDFYIGDTHLEGSTLFISKMIQELGNDIPYERIQVDVTTLDILLEQLNINKIDILKLDAEGAERKILRGAEKILKNSPGLKMLTEFGTFAISSSGESPIEYLTFLINRFKEVRILRDGKELGDGRDIIDYDNVKDKSRIVCTNIFCQ